MPDTLICPNCSVEIEVSAALSAQLREHLRKEFDADARRKDADLAKREGILNQEEQALDGRRQALEQCEFRQRIEGIVQAFMTLKDDLDSERRSMHRIWSKREKQLARAAANTAGLYGDLAGIVGAHLPPIANLELASIAGEAEPLDSEDLEMAAATSRNNETF